MRHADRIDETGQSGFTIGYDLSTVGTWVRIVVGVVASLAAITTDVVSNQPTAGYVSQTGLWFVVILAVYTAVYALLAPRVLPRLNPWVSTLMFYGPVLVLPYVQTLPDSFRFALTLYIIISIVVAVFIRYGGCEVVGIPALLIRRRYVVYCPWNTADIVDKAIEDSRWSGELQGLGVKIVAAVVVIGVLFASFFALRDAGPLVWLLAAVASVAVVAVWVLGRRAFSRQEASVE